MSEKKTEKRSKYELLTAIANKIMTDMEKGVTVFSIQSLRNTTSPELGHKSVKDVLALAEYCQTKFPKVEILTSGKGKTKYQFTLREETG